MKKYIFASGAAATLLSVVLLAANIDGKWVLETQGQKGKATQTLTLKAEGGKLTGTMDNQGTQVDGKVDISEGTIDGSKVAFTVVRDMNGTKTTRKFSGTMEGTDLKLTVETAGGAGGGPGAGKGGPGGAPDASKGGPPGGAPDAGKGGPPGGGPGAAGKGGPGAGKGGAQEMVFKKQ